MGGVEQDTGADLVGNGADFSHWMLEQVQAAADGDQLRAFLFRQLAQPVEVDGVTVGVDRGVVDLQPVETGTAGLVVGDVAARWQPAER